MNTPIITWVLIVSILCIAVISRLFALIRFSNKRKRGIRVLEIGSEREEFFIPGDSTDYDDE